MLRDSWSVVQLASQTKRFDLRKHGLHQSYDAEIQFWWGKNTQCALTHTHNQIQTCASEIDICHSQSHFPSTKLISSHRHLSRKKQQNFRFNRRSYWRLIQSSELSLVFIMKEILTSSGNNLTSILTLKLTLTLFFPLTLTLMLPLTPNLNQTVTGKLFSRSHLTGTLTHYVGEPLG